jgi:predicted transglutaminase-like cysteine proteinase
MVAHREIRAQTVLVIVVILVIVIIGLYCYFEFWRTEPPEPEQLVKLRVDLSESGEWQSDIADSPLYISNVTYVISNYGTGTAEGIQATIRIDDVVFDEFSLVSLGSKNSFTDKFSVSMNFDSSKEISLTASCENSTDTGVITINAFLARTLDPDLARFYITPSDSIIQQTLENIVNNPLVPDWIEIRDWVANEIEYVSDIAAHGVSEYWQLPRETLSLGTGDCEDFSILLCSFYRAIGWNINEVYVVIGEKEGMYHAWVKLNVDIIGWQNIEPQAGGLNTVVGDFLSLSGYTAKYNFNDAYFNAV